MMKSPPTRSSSSTSNNGGNSNGGMDPPSKSFNTRFLLKIGLIASVSFHFIWVAKQLSALSAPGSLDELLISPEYTKEHGRRDLHAGNSSSSSSSSSGGGGNINIFNTIKPLPLHPSPNADLQNLVSSHTKYDCPEGLIYVEDHILPDNVTHPLDRKIPHLLHVTSKSRCMTQAFASNIDRWKTALGAKYSIYIHDDEAVNKFIYQKEWTEFPELKEVMACITAGVSFQCCLI